MVARLLTLSLVMGAGVISDARPLRHYVADVGLVKAPFMPSANNVNLSGQTWVPGPDGGRFFWIQNAPEDSTQALWETDASFRRLRTIELDGFGDSEDLVFLGGDGAAPELAIVNEAGTLFIVTVDDETDFLDADDAEKIQFATTDMGNKGTEGIAYDASTDTFYACKEKSPMAVYTFSRSNGWGDASTLFNAEAKLGSAIDDISSCHFDARTGRLLILSHESHKILDVRLDGTIVDELALPESDKQYEGLTLDGAKNLVLSSEPNLVRVYANSVP